MIETVSSPLEVETVPTIGSMVTAPGACPTGNFGWARWQPAVSVALQVAALMTETLVSSILVTATARVAGSKAMAEGPKLAVAALACVGRSGPLCVFAWRVVGTVRCEHRSATRSQASVCVKRCGDRHAFDRGGRTFGRAGTR